MPLLFELQAKNENMAQGARIFYLFSCLSLCLAISLVLRKSFKVRYIIFIIYCVTCGTTLVTSNSNMITHTVEKYVSMEYFKL